MSEEKQDLNRALYREFFAYFELCRLYEPLLPDPIFNHPDKAYVEGPLCEIAQTHLVELQAKRADIFAHALGNALLHDEFKPLVCWLYWESGIPSEEVLEFLITRYFPRHTPSSLKHDTLLLDPREIAHACALCHEPYTATLRSPEELRQFQLGTQHLLKMGDDFPSGLHPHYHLLCHSCNRKRGIEALRQLPYDEYLKTDHWQWIREEQLCVDGHQCRLCHATERLHVHHATYEHLGEEFRHWGDLITLCAECHARHHGKEPRRRGTEEGPA